MDRAMTTALPLRCPQCGQSANVGHFRDSPDCAAAAYRIVGMVRQTKRKTISRAGGRPKKLVACQRCSQQVGTAEARFGHPGCPVRALSGVPD